MLWWTGGSWSHKSGTMVENNEKAESMSIGEHHETGAMPLCRAIGPFYGTWKGDKPLSLKHKRTHTQIDSHMHSHTNTLSHMHARTHTNTHTSYIQENKP